MIAMLMIPFVSSMDIYISANMNKEIYSSNDILNAEVFLGNITNTLQTIELRSIIATNVNQLFQPRIDQRTIILEPNEQKTITIFSIPIESSFPSANYTFGAEAIKNGQKIAESSASFKIIGTLKEPLFKYFLCSDAECTQKKKVFIKNEPIYVWATSNMKIQDAIRISKSSNISPMGETARMSVTKLGTSFITGGLQVNKALVQSAPLNKTSTIKIQTIDPQYIPETIEVPFAVIEKHATIQNASRCNANLICENTNGENKQTCPQDCV